MTAKELNEEYFQDLYCCMWFCISCGYGGKVCIRKASSHSRRSLSASEFRYSEPLLDESSLVIVISQSGETLDSMAALREAKRKGSKVLSIVNVMGSSIARESDYVLYTWADPEIAVATHKSVHHTDGAFTYAGNLSCKTVKQN